MSISKLECHFERSNMVVVILVLSILNTVVSLLVLLGFLYFVFPAK